MSLEAMVNLILPEEFFKSGRLVTRDGYEITSLDKVEIMQVLNRYDWAYCSKHHEALADLVTDDIVFDHAMVHAEGKKQFLNVDQIQALIYGLRHTFSNQVVFINAAGNPACLSYMHVFQVASPESTGHSMPLILDSAIVIDEMRKENGQWRIAKRTQEQQKIADFAPLPPDIRKALAQTQKERSSQRERP